MKNSSRRPSIEGPAPQYVPEMSYSHEPVETPDDHAHNSAQKIGETPAAPLTRQLTRQLTRRITHGKDALRTSAEPEETDEDRMIIRRKSIAVAQLAVFKVEKDAKGGEKEVRTDPALSISPLPSHPHLTLRQPIQPLTAPPGLLLPPVQPRRSGSSLDKAPLVQLGDMKLLLRQSALDIAAEAIVRGGWDNELAAFIKKRMERSHQSISGGKWHCIVGPDFGSYVTHEKGHFAYFYLPRDFSPLEALEKTRAERRARNAASATGGGMTTDEVKEKSLEKEVGRRSSIAGFSPEAMKLSEEHPMLDQRRSSTIGKGDEEKRMVGILIWRT